MAKTAGRSAATGAGCCFQLATARQRLRELEARKQWDESGKLVADDTILEDGSRQRKAGAIDS